MKIADYKFTLRTDRTPQDLFQAILKVREWWTGYHNEDTAGNTE